MTLSFPTSFIGGLVLLCSHIGAAEPRSIAKPSFSRDLIDSLHPQFVFATGKVDNGATDFTPIQTGAARVSSGSYDHAMVTAEQGTAVNCDELAYKIRQKIESAYALVPHKMDTSSEVSDRDSGVTAHSYSYSRVEDTAKPDYGAEVRLSVRVLSLTDRVFISIFYVHVL